MKATLIDAQGASTLLSGNDLAASLPQSGFFWLDIASATADEFAALAGALQLDETASAWLSRFGQSSRCEISAQQMRFSTWANGGKRGVVEAHLLSSPAWLITVFDGAVSGRDRWHTGFRQITDSIATHPDYAIGFVLNELVTGLYPRLECADEILDKLEDDIFLNPKPEQLFALADLRREISSLHRRLVPLYNTLKALIATAGGIGIASVGIKATPWLHTYSERLIDLVERIDSYRQRTSEAMEGYGANQANRQSEQINRLTVISWVFLPLTFLTGFFGMNFKWAVNGLLATEDAFMLLGIGLPVLALVLTLLLFKSLGWVGAWRRKQQQAAAVSSLVSGAAKARGERRRAR